MFTLQIFFSDFSKFYENYLKLHHVKSTFAGMEKHKTYIQQIYYDGSSYTKGSVVDIETEFGCVATDFPLLAGEEMKEVVAREWAGEDGRDVYMPAHPAMQHYDVTATFAFKGAEDMLRDNISRFLRFVTGRNIGATGGMLAIYNTYTKDGRKDVHVTKIDPDMYYCEEYDDEKSATIDITFMVEDPATDVKPVLTEGKVTDLQFVSV